MKRILFAVLLLFSVLGSVSAQKPPSGFQPGAPWPKRGANNLNNGVGVASGSNGTLLWQKSFLEVDVVAVDADETIYGVSGIFGFFALTKDGTLKPNFNITRLSYHAPAIGQGGVLYLGTYDGHFSALNPDSSVIWSVPCTTSSTPTIGTDGTVYVGTTTTTPSLMAFNPDGSIKWSVPTQGQVGDFSPALGPDGTIYITTSYLSTTDNLYHGNLYAIGSDGTIHWQVPSTTPIVTSPAIGPDGSIYVTTNGNLYAFNSDGTLKWTFTPFQFAPLDYIVSMPAIGPDGTIYVGSYYSFIDSNNVSYLQGLLYAVAPTGATKWTYQLPIPMTSQSAPAIAPDGTIYVGTNTTRSSGHLSYPDCNFVALNSDGTLKWQNKTAGGNPVIGTAGTVYSVGSVTQGLSYIQALSPPPPSDVPLSAFTVAPTTVIGGNFVTFNITLASPANLGGDSVVLTSDSPYAVVKPSLNVLPGDTTLAFVVVIPAVAADTVVTVTATSGGVTLSAPLTIKAPTFTQLTVNPTSVIGGATSIGTVTIGSPAPANISIALSSDNVAATVPSSVTFAKDAKTANFNITTSGVDSQATATITGTFQGVSQAATLRISQASLSTVTCAKTDFVSGSTTQTTGTVTLNGKAGPSGIVVALSSSNSSLASIPTSVTVAPNAATASFNVSTPQVLTADQSVTLTATYAGVSKTVVITLRAFAVQTLTINPTGLNGGAFANGSVSINATPLTQSITIALSSNKTSAQLPSSVTIAANSTSAIFGITTNPISSSEVNTITAQIGSSSKTATLTVFAAPVSSLSVSPTNVVGGSNSVVTGTITLAAVAGPNGNLISLSSSNTAVASVPSSILVPAGSSIATFTVSDKAVSSNQTVTLTSTFEGNQKTATLTVAAMLLTGMSVNPKTVIGGSSALGAVSISQPAGPAGIVVNLSSASSNVQVPTSVTFAPGTTLATFNVTTSHVNSDETDSISATVGSSTKSVTLTLTAVNLASISVVPTSLVGGNTPVATVTLTSAAPTGGEVVALSSNSSFVTLPASVTVPAGATTTTFNVPTSGVDSTTVITLTATLGTDSKNCTLTLLIAKALSLGLVPSAVVGGSATTVTATFKLNGRAGPSGDVVTLSSSNTAIATVPGSITVAPNALSVTFKVTHYQVNSQTPVTIAGTVNGTSQTAALTVNPYSVNSVSFSPSSIVGGYSSTGTVTLSEVAGSAGIVVNLSSTSSDVQVPATVTVASGSSSGTFTANSSIIGGTETVPVKASIGTSVQSGNLTLTGVNLAGLTTTPTTLVGGNTPTGTVTLTIPAPPGGAVVILSSNNSSVIPPATVTVPAGATSATFNIPTLGVDSTTTATLTATLFAVSKTASLTLLNAKMLSLTLSQSSVLGGSSTSIVATVRLNGKAGPSGNVVTLSSSNTAAATMPATITIAPGAVSATVAVSHYQVTSASQVTLGATCNATTQSTTLTVNPYLVSSISLNPTTVIGGSSSTGTVTISQAAGPAGIGVSIASGNADAQVPPTVVIPSGATSANFTVTTVKPASNETVAIMASIGASQSSANLTISASSLSSVTIQGSIVGGNTPNPGTVTLTGPAPVGGLVVALQSSNSALSVQSSVTVPEGATSATFTMTTAGVDSNVVATVTATLGPTSKSANMSIVPAWVLSLTLSTSTVVGSSSTVVTARVALIGKAGPSGAVVNLSSDNPSAANVPTTITIPAGTVAGTVTVAHFTVATSQTATILASYLGHAASAVLTVKP